MARRGPMSNPQAPSSTAVQCTIKPGRSTQVERGASSGTVALMADRRLTPLVVVLGALSSCTCAEPPGLGPSAPSHPLDLVGRAQVPRPGTTAPNEPALFVAVGENLPAAVGPRLFSLLRLASSLPVVELALAPLEEEPLPFFPAGSRIIALGGTTLSRRLIDAVELAALPPEGFVLRSGTIDGVPALVADGAGPEGRGAAYGAYALLEELGYAFLHPLAPTLPAALPEDFPVVDRTEAPRWPTRNWHLHTMHPLELTDLLNGWGPEGPDDEAGWESMLPEWDLFLEWLLANRQNEVEWVLLEAATWADFAQSDVRQARLAALVERAHDYGIHAGIDVPIALIQQHTFRLLLEEGDDTPEGLAGELAQIRARIDWLMAAGFDFLSTENGSTEFTHPSPERMLAWMNEVARHVDETWGGEASIKIHCSTGQTAEPFLDEEAGEPLNFNHLPHYADSRLGVMPHTVQHYGLDDPAPTYGNTDFGYVREFLQEEVGRRKVIWHPETAYWVSFDVDVPLFLPLYAERRQSDLRLLAGDEGAGRMGRGSNAGGRMDGQSVFSSGWEWGYWLNDVVAARAAWDPLVDEPSPRAAFVRALRPLERALGDAGPATARLLADVAEIERAQLIEGRVDGAAPDDVVRRNGQAYLQGSEAFDDLMDAANDLLPVQAPETQPVKLGLVEMLNPLHEPPAYTAEIDPLLDEMEQSLTAAADTLDALRAMVPPGALDLFDDLADSLRITALRARQVHGLYDYADGFWTSSEAERLPRLEDARQALDEAAAIVAAREARYRVPADRISSWGENPTAYEFRYLWTVRSLYYWWRDEVKAVKSPASPCVHNIMNPADVALGEGGLTDGARVIRDLTDGGLLDGLGECLAEPSAEPAFPPAGLR